MKAQDGSLKVFTEFYPYTLTFIQNENRWLLIVLVFLFTFGYAIGFDKLLIRPNVVGDLTWAICRILVFRPCVSHYSTSIIRKGRNQKKDNSEKNPV